MKLIITVHKGVCWWFFADFIDLVETNTVLLLPSNYFNNVLPTLCQIHTCVIRFNLKLIDEYRYNHKQTRTDSCR